MTSSPSVSDLLPRPGISPDVDDGRLDVSGIGSESGVTVYRRLFHISHVNNTCEVACEPVSKPYHHPTNMR